ncbi:MAG: hypothetical protein HY053_06165 [Proteobacteria bacterium]|nr:hypothetical protein [Pseudomonadota bacterium]
MTIDLRKPIENIVNRIPEKHCAQLGRMSSAWAFFEYCVNVIIWRMAEISYKRGACLTAQFPNMERRFDALAALVAQECEDKTFVKKIHDFAEETIHDFAEETHKLSLERNRLVHDLWELNPESGPEKKLIFGYKEINGAKIEHLLISIYEHIGAFELLAKDCYDAMRVSGKKL